MLSALASNTIAREIEEKRAPAPEMVCTTEHTEEQKLNVAVMTFTPEEADDLLSRLKAEREEAERKAAERRAGASRGALSSNAKYSPSYFKRAGVIHWGGWRWTWYSERILPGYGLRIPGRHTDGLGYVRDGNGYLCLASDALAKGTIIDTPFGSRGVIYDCGCGYSTIDVYVGW